MFRYVGGCSRNTCNDVYDIVTILRRPQLPILRGDRLKLSFCIHHIYMNNRSPAPHTARGAPNRIARHQRETYNKSLHNTTKARASSCARRNARPHTRSHPARPQTIPHDCPGHRGRHSATCPHAAAQSMPEAVAQRQSFCNEIYDIVVDFVTKKRAPRGGCAPARDRPPDRSHGFPGTARDPPSLDPAVGRQVDGRAVEMNVPMSRCAV